MAIFLTILKFISCAVGVFTTCLLVLSCIGSIVNPQMSVVDDKVVEKGDNARIVFAIIMAVAWATFAIL